MEWKSLSILAVICQLTVTVHGGLIGGTSSLFTDEKKARSASVVMCHPDQTFFCVNLTHYSPCIHLDLSDLVNTSYISQEVEFYCGAGRCCQVGADSPCTYHCQRQSLNFGNPRIPWNFSRVKKTKKKRSKKEPLTSEEVDRLNRIVSVKNFIIRQKDLEDWDDYDLQGEDNGFGWRPSYRTFCPLKIRVSNPECNTINIPCQRATDLRTVKPATTTSVQTITTTTKKPNTKSTTSKSTTTRKSTTTTKSTTRTTKTTVKTTTRKPVPTWTTQYIKFTTKPIKTSKGTTRKRRTTKTTPKRKVTHRTTRKITKRTKRTPKMKHNKHRVPSNALPCNGTYLNKRTFVPGSCEAYFECIKLGRKYNWKIYQCKNNYFFDSGTSQCTTTGNANCDIINPESQAGRGKRWNERIVHT